MKKTALEAAIEAAGTVTELARRIGASPQVIANWRSRPSGIPADRVLDVERATIPRDERGQPIAGAAPLVTRFELKPAIYPAEEAA